MRLGEGSAFAASEVWNVAYFSKCVRKGEIGLCAATVLSDRLSPGRCGLPLSSKSRLVRAECVWRAPARNTHTNSHAPYIHLDYHPSAHTYARAHTHTYTHARANTHTHIQTQTHTHAHTHTHTHTHMHTHALASLPSVNSASGHPDCYPPCPSPSIPPCASPPPRSFPSRPTPVREGGRDGRTERRRNGGR